jgi:outer membrane protein OmpA-like peptidoglycan-associated protein
MSPKIGIWIGLLLAAAGCAGTVHLKEEEPLVITGGAPAPAPAPPPKVKHVKVKADRIDVSGTIQFDFSSSRISEESEPLLDEIAGVMTRHPELKKIRIEGHTDNQGDSPHNLSLSKKRAAAVVKYLVAHGVDADRLVSEGYGQSKPIASNDDEDGRSKNRRVAFVILERGSKAAGAAANDDDDDSDGDK